MATRAVFDSSFWINAQRAGLLPHVLSRYRLVYAPAIAAELRESFPAGAEFWRCVRAGTLEQQWLASAQLTEFGTGERAAINLALEHQDWVLLLDDYRPFQRAVQLGLKVVTTPVLTMALYDEGTISAQEALITLAKLAASQTVSPHLLSAALSQLGRTLRDSAKNSNSG